MLRVAGISFLAATALIVGVITVQPVLAQMASSTEPEVASTTPAEIVESSEIVDEETAVEEPQDSTDPEATTEEDLPTSEVVADRELPALTFADPAEDMPEGLEKVYIIGYKYTDYFSNGSEVLSFPGDPQIDAFLNEADASIPTREGVTWDHTTGSYLFDTETGDLEEGQYALQPSGRYIIKLPPFVSSTSTPESI